jgi:hypothetical protein
VNTGNGVYGLRNKCNDLRMGFSGILDSMSDIVGIGSITVL